MKKDSKGTEKESASKESVTYQKMLADVETIVREVASPDLDLDAMVGKVEQGYGLIKTMRERLETTKTRIEQLRSDFEES
jgi:exodeoxyribonuclease VII small subunit